METVKQVFKPDLEWLRSIGCSVYGAAMLIGCDASHLRRVLNGERKSYKLMFLCCKVLTPKNVDAYRRYRSGGDDDEICRIYYDSPLAFEEGWREFEEWKAVARRLEAEGKF